MFWHPACWQPHAHKQEVVRAKVGRGLQVERTSFFKLRLDTIDQAELQHSGGTLVPGCNADVDSS